MPLWTPRGLSGYGFEFSSTGATRVAAAWGTSITPGNNTMGSYTQVLTGANVSQDVFGLFVSVNSNNVSTAARDTILDVGVDSAGGSSYVVLLPQLLVSQAAGAIAIAGGSGIHYFFPIWIKAGSTVAARASVNNVTVGTLRCAMKIVGAPRDRRNARVGQRVIAYGITAGTSTGTAVTPGTTSDGTWTALGTIASGDRPWFFQYGMGLNQGTTTATSYSSDLSVGSASAKAIVCEDRVWTGTTAETWSDDGPDMTGYYQAAPTDIVYGRSQCSGTAMSGISMAAWGVV